MYYPEREEAKQIKSSSFLLWFLSYSALSFICSFLMLVVSYVSIHEDIEVIYIKDIIWQRYRSINPAQTFFMISNFIISAKRPPLPTTTHSKSVEPAFDHVTKHGT